MMFNFRLKRTRIACFAWLMMLGFASIYNPAACQEILWLRQVEGFLEDRPMTVYHGGMEYCKPVLADLDGDGDGDLFVGEHDGYLNIFINDGNIPPGWTCLTTAFDSIDVGKQNAPAFWDVDDDGDLDLFIGDEDGDVWYFRNDGSSNDLNFTLVTENYIAPLLVDYHSIPFFADVDDDDDDDLLIGHNDGGAALYLNAGSVGAPTWSYQTDFYAGIDIGDKSAVCVFDVDDDDLGDLFISGVEGDIYYYHNDGPPQTPSYTDLGVVFDVGHNGTPTFWDIDEDGDLDLISGESDGNLNLLLNQGTPTAPDWQLESTQVAFMDVGFRSLPTLVDIDADDDLDMFIGRLQYGIVFLENCGTADSAAWRMVSGTYAGYNPTGVKAPAFYDLDDDGDYDLVVGTANGTLTYIENGGTPQAASWLTPVTQYTGVDVGDNATPVIFDADNDGDGDLLIGMEDGALRFVRNDGTPSSPAWVDLGNYPGIDVGTYSAPAFADLDSDGDYDLLIGNGYLGGFLALYRNLGSALLPSWSFEINHYQDWDFGDYAAPCFADMDHDGDPDLLMGCESGGVWFWENGGLLYDVQISLLPYDPPIVIPAAGGDFDYIIWLENGETIPLPVVAWTEILRPDGQLLEVDDLQLNLSPGTISELMTFDVPQNWPPGEYTFTGYTGATRELVYSEDSFTFNKEDSLGIGPDSNPRPVTHLLLQSYPNPFNHRVTIEYQLPAAGEVQLAVYTVAGERVANLQDAWQRAGTHRLDYDAGGLSTGIYLLKLEGGGRQSIQKLLYLK